MAIPGYIGGHKCERAQIQYQRELDGGAERLNCAPCRFTDLVTDFTQGLSRRTSNCIGLIGPQIGNEVVARAGKGAPAALIGMVVYISWRFGLRIRWQHCH